MSIQELKGKFKAFFRNPEYLLALLIIGVALASFFLGRLSAQEEAIRGQSIFNMATTTASISSAVEEAQPQPGAEKAISSETSFVASKNGTKYYPITCSGAKRISEQNKILFKSAEEALAAGYTLARNCGGS